jgi:hypothetical protein
MKSMPEKRLFQQHIKIEKKRWNFEKKPMSKNMGIPL